MKMAKPGRVIKPEKQQEVETLRAKFGEAKGIVLADYTGVTVAEVSELRRKCREAGVEYKVVKNTLAKIAARDADIAGLADHFDGPIAIALSSVDTAAPARVLSDFVKNYQKMTLKVGYFDGRIYSQAQIDEIANLPSREVLVALLIGTIQSPISQLIWCLESGMRDVVSVIDQAGKKAGASS